MRRISRHFTHNAGGIFSYCLAGIIAGFAGSLTGDLSVGDAAPFGSIITGIFMMGFYLGGWWRALQ
jgi:sulfite exporter TauE/SafE